MNPNWVKNLSSDLRPDKKRIKELEKLRYEYGIPGEALAIRILSSPATTRKVQRDTLELIRYQMAESGQYPGISEKELLKMLLLSRIKSGDAWGLSSNMKENEIDQVVENMKSIDDFCKFVTALDETDSPPFPDPFGIGKRIDDILLQEEIEKIAPSESLIKSLEDAYYELSQKNPERDEHWLLAHTWLKRYGDTKEAKQKGPGVINFIAYPRVAPEITFKKAERKSKGKEPEQLKF